MATVTAKKHNLIVGTKVEIVKYNPYPTRFTEEEKKQFGIGDTAKITELSWWGKYPTYILNNNRKWHWHEWELESVKEDTKL